MVVRFEWSVGGLLFGVGLGGGKQPQSLVRGRYDTDAPRRLGEHRIIGLSIDYHVRIDGE